MSLGRAGRCPPGSRADLLEIKLFAYSKEHKNGVALTLPAALIGAALEVTAFYNGWFG